MKFGIAVPNFGAYAKREQILEISVLAEELRYDSLWVSDHIIIPGSHEGFGDTFLDPLVTLTYIAANTDRIELGLRAQMVATNVGSSATRETGAGDTDLLLKWRISTQGEILPAIALGLGCTLPTGNASKGFQSAEHASARLMVIGTSEQEMPGDYFIGIYFEGQIVYSDLDRGAEPKPYADKYGVFNAGLLFPLTGDRSLQAIFEYNAVVKKDIPSVYEQDHKSLMPGLRYVTDRLNVSLGVQFMNREDPAFKNDLRYIGTLSYAF